MAEESFQLEQILKRQYHADIRQKCEQNRKLALDNETLRQQIVSKHKQEKMHCRHTTRQHTAGLDCKTVFVVR